MSERQPIDDHFRRALHEVEITPPEAVWEGIVRKRSRRRSGFFGWSVALLLLLGGAAALLLTDGGEQPTDLAMSTSTTPSPQQAQRARTTQGQADTSPTQLPAVQPSSVEATTLSTGPVSSTVDPYTTSRGSVSYSKKANNESAVRSMPVAPATTRSAGSNTPLKGDPAGPRALSARSNEGHSILVARRDDDHHTMASRIVAVTQAPIIRDNLKPGPDRLPYVLHNADWWVALELGRYNVDRTWYGKDSELADALNRTELPHDTWSVGVLGGRSWRSGFGLSLGAAYEASERAYNHLDSRTRVDSLDVIAYLVTLDTQVFVSNMDTTVYGTTEKQQVVGSNSLSVLHIPIEAYWHAQRRRWTYGARVGLTGEFITQRTGYTLETNTEGEVYSADLGLEIYDTRYATTLTGMVGVDVGFAVNEHLGLWATPTYMHGLASWSDDSGPWMLPERFGLRVRLTYTFSCIP